MKRIIFLCAITFLLQSIKGQELLRFSIPGKDYEVTTPVSVPLNGIKFNNNKGEPVLFELTGEGEKYVPSQIETGHNPVLWFILSPPPSGKGREFILKQMLLSGDGMSPEKIKIVRDRRDLHLHYNNKPILNYRHKEKYPPDSIDPIYKRSGFIHPLWSPDGFRLTRIQPPDHYHHYGIWGPWTKTHIDGREVDFWNLAKGHGTVKFSDVISKVEGSVYSGFQVLQKHLDFGNRGADQAALNEQLEIRAWNTGNNVWIIDYTTTLNSPLENGIMFDAYRYGGGLGFRATEKWEKDNCSVLSSENKTRANADGSNARWCIIEGESDSSSGRSGMLFLSHPSNRMHPEPMRVWPENAVGGRGDMFFEFTPIRHQSWKIEPNQNYTLKYRIIVFDGEMSAEEAEEYWRGFGEGLSVVATGE